MVKHAHKTAGEIDVTALADEIKSVDAEYDEKFRELESRRQAAKEEKIQGLKEQRGKLASQRNDIDIALTKLDKLIAELSGKKAPVAASSGKRVRRTAEQMEAEKKELAAAGKTLYTYLSKHEGRHRVRDLAGKVLGVNASAALQPYVDAKLVRKHPNGPRPEFEFAKEGELPSA